MTLKELAEDLRNNAIKWTKAIRLTKRKKVQDTLQKDDVEDFDTIIEYLGGHEPDNTHKPSGI